MTKKKSGNWIKGAVKPANKGKFTAQAQKSGKSVAGFADEVLSSGSKASTTTKRRAVFAQNMQKIAARKRGK